MRKHNCKGFTLIEIIIAIFILVIITGIIVGGLNIAVRSENQISERADFTEQLQMTMIILTRDIRQFVDRPIIDNNGTTLPGLMGPNKEQIIQFTRMGFVNPLGFEQRSELLRVAYLLQGNTLIRSTWRALDRAPGSTFSSRSLLPSIQKITVRYLNVNRQFYRAPVNSSAGIRTPLGINFDFEFTDGRHIERFFAIPGASNES